MRNIILILSVISMLASCGDADTPIENTTKNPATPSAKIISYAVVKTYPHDTSSYTQGLVVYKGNMYEGTGNYGRSHLQQVNVITGKIERQIPLNQKYFGEGITILNDTVYQLTWKEKTAFVYTLKDFKKIKEVPLQPEGWGLTHNGKELIASDGSSTLYFYNPSDFKLINTVTVTEGGQPVSNINELEYINGFLYANQFQYPYIFKIDPSSGVILGKIDLTDLWQRVRVTDPHADVPNGIAYDEATGKIYITGKNWAELYEITMGS